MSAVLLAMFDDYESANDACIKLVRDGFPTDRVELTARHDPGRAGLEPGETLHAKFSRYFETVCSGDRECTRRLANAVDNGATTVTVHPRGIIEVERAMSILEQAGATEFFRHGLEKQAFEHAAARHDRAWIRHFWVDLPPESAGEFHCIYCRLFERRAASSV